MPVIDRSNPMEPWRCVEVASAAAAEPIGSVRAWQDVLDRAAAIRRLGDVDVPGYSGLFRIRTRREADRFYLFCERPESS